MPVISPIIAQVAPALVSKLGSSWRSVLWGFFVVICGGVVVAGGFVVPGTAFIAIPSGLGFMGIGGALLTTIKDRATTGIGAKATSDPDKDGTKQ